MKSKLALVFTAAICGAMLQFLPGCASPAGGTAAAGQEASGARLWAQNCSRCHNSRSPSEYSNAQWDVAMLHMRVRANLTANEHRKILEFLQSER